MATKQEVEERMRDRDYAEMFGWHEDRIEAELPIMFTDEEWEVMLSDPRFGYVCGQGHRLQEADHRYGACLTCEAIWESMDVEDYG